ncbi:MAG: hypothetical protein ACRYE8_01715 [Janthinobacterium lividum]
MRKSKSTLGVMPWLDHGIHKNNKKYYKLAFFSWIASSLCSSQ